MDIITWLLFLLVIAAVLLKSLSPFIAMSIDIEGLPTPEEIDVPWPQPPERI